MVDPNEADELAEALPPDEDDADYSPPEPQRRPGPVAVVLALLAVAGFGAVAYAPARSWFTIEMGAVKAEDRAREGTFLLLVDGTGEREAKITGKDQPRGEIPKIKPLPSEVAPEGNAIRYVAIAGAVWVIVGLGLLMFWNAPRATRERLNTLVPGIGSVFAQMLVAWLMGWLIKVVMLNRLIAEKVAEGAGFGGGRIDTMPGLGLFVALGAALLATFALNVLGRHVLKGSWLYAFQLGGFLVGAGIVCAVAEPWTAEALWEATRKP